MCTSTQDYVYINFIKIEDVRFYYNQYKIIGDESIENFCESFINQLWFEWLENVNKDFSLYTLSN